MAAESPLNVARLRKPRMSIFEIPSAHLTHASSTVMSFSRDPHEESCPKSKVSLTVLFLNHQRCVESSNVAILRSCCYFNCYISSAIYNLLKSGYPSNLLMIIHLPLALLVLFIL